MRAIDTNVLARWVLGDDPAQAAIAADLLGEPVLISLTVLTELGWVLEKAVGIPRSLVASMIGQIVCLEHARIEKRGAVLLALDRYREGADWADMLHLVAVSGEASSFATFDRALGRDAGIESPVTVELLRSDS